ncbi:MAG: carbohydrate ABC transporter permease [Candidatus Promineifilaceae bacterium]
MRVVFSLRRATGRSISFTILAFTLSLIVIIPLMWIFFGAVKDRGRIIRNPLGFPEVWHWENFSDAWIGGNFSTYFVNSIVVVVPVVVGILLLALLAAYAFAMMSFRGRDGLFILFLAGMTIPLSVLIIPLFYEMIAIHLNNTLWALILPQIAIALPFSILLIYSFIRDLPREILDSGRIDGCNSWNLLRHIVTPLSRPALLTLLVFNFMWTWNQFLLPIVLIQIDSKRTLPVGLNFFQGQFANDIPLLMAGATITFMPIVIIYLIFQRHFIQGIAAGALKS